MNRQLLLWLAIPLAAFTLSACDAVDDEIEDDDDDDTTAVTDDDGEESTSYGVPDFEGFSLAVDNAVVSDALNTDGITATFTVQVANRYNAAVEDGTVIYFWAENGYLLTNTCSTASGSCSVTWTSGGMRPLDGLATVLAYTVGEDSFSDNGTSNYIFNLAGDVVDEGGDGLALDEAIISAPEAFKDYNFDDSYDTSSFTDGGTGLTFSEDAFYDYDDSGEYEASSSLYRGEDCSTSALAAGHCEETSVHVWAHTQIAWGPSYASAQVAVSGVNTTDFGSVTAVADWNVGDTIYVLVADSNGNTPEAGTSISVAADDADTDDFSVRYSAQEVPVLGQANGFPYLFALTLTTATEGAGTSTITVTYNDADYTLYVDY